MRRVTLTDDENFELCWLLTSLVCTAADSDFTSGGKVVNASASIISPHVLVRLYKKIVSKGDFQDCSASIVKLESIVETEI